MKFVLAVGLILLLIGLVMVLSSAFKHRFGWGVSILLLPVIAPLYGVYKWSDHQARNGLLTVVVGLLVVAAAFYGGVGRDIASITDEVPNQEVQDQVKELVEIIPTALPPDEPLPNQDKADEVQVENGVDYDPIYGDDPDAYTKIDALPPEEDKRVFVPEKPKVKYEFQVITTAQVGKFNNKLLKLATKRGELREGKLIRSDEDSLYLESKVDAGKVQFQYKFKDIAALLVYEAKGVVAAMNAAAIEVNSPALDASTTQVTPALNASTTQVTPALNASTTQVTPALNASTTQVTPATNASTTSVTPALNASTTQVTPELSASKSNDIPVPSASTNHGTSGASDAQTMNQSLPAHRGLKVTTNPVANPATQTTAAKTAESSLQAKQAGTQTKPATTSSVSVESKNVTPMANSGAKPVIIIKSKPSPTAETDKTAQQPEPEPTKPSETSMVVPVPAAPTDAPAVQ